MFNASSLVTLSVLPVMVVIAVAAMIFIGVKTNVVSSVFDQIMEYIVCYIVAKLITNQKKQILKLTSEYDAAVIKYEIDTAETAAATKVITDVVTLLEQTMLIVPVNVPLGMIHANTINAIVEIHLALRYAKISEECAMKCSAASFKKMKDLRNRINVMSVTAFDG